ncbi:MAG: hypothetical protein AAB368_13620, partial [bacterium]
SPPPPTRRFRLHNHLTLPDALLGLLLAASAATDLASRRILNAFTYPAIVAGCCWAVLHGAADLGDSAGAALVATVVM